MENVDLDVTSLGVGFDLRLHGYVVLVRPAIRSCAYDVNGEPRVVRGTREQIMAALARAGYRTTTKEEEAG